MVLITGATGFLGTELLQQLIQKEYEVRALYRNEGKIPAQFKNHPKVQWFPAEINDMEAMEQALEGITQVYHCAAKVAIDEKAKKELFKVNIEGTAQLVDLCLARPHLRLVHVSSVAALSVGLDQEMIDENAKWEFDAKSSMYSISKFESELEVWRGIAEGLQAVIVNPSLIIGGNEAGSLSFQLQQMLKKGFPYYPKGGVGVVDVKDVAQCMILLMESHVSGERYIVSSENYTYQQLFTDFAQALKLKAPQKPIGPFGLTLGYYAGKLLQWFGNQPNPLSKDLIKSVSEKLYFSNAKITQTLQYQFIPVKQSIQASCK